MEGPFESISIVPTSTDSSGEREADANQCFHPLYLHNIFENEHQVAQYNRHTPLLTLFVDKSLLCLVEVKEFDNECLIDAAEIHQLNQKIASLFTSSSFRFSHVGNMVSRVEHSNFLFYYGAIRHLREIYLKFFPFILFYIETASMIEFEDPDWECIIMLNKKDFAPIGLCSYYYFRGLGVHRIRLSQFVILPWFQQGGMGRILYDSFYLNVVLPSSAQEFTGTSLFNF